MIYVKSVTINRFRAFHPVGATGSDMVATVDYHSSGGV